MADDTQREYESMDSLEAKLKLFQAENDKVMLDIESYKKSLAVY